MCRLVLIATFAFFGMELQGQMIEDSNSSKRLPVVAYYEALGEQSPLYNGREYVDYAPFIKIGHPFYEKAEFTTAKVHFEDMIFEDARLMYDIHKDKLIQLHFNNVFKIDLPVEKISEFWMYDHHFIRLYADSTKVIEEGYYDKMYEGRTSFFIRRRKLIREDRTANDIIRVIDQKDLYFIRKGNSFHGVRTFNSLLSALSDKQGQVKQHLKKRGLKFRKGREAAILAAVREYDRLTD